jgi:hypothetical protein
MDTCLVWSNRGFTQCIKPPADGEPPPSNGKLMQVVISSELASLGLWGPFDRNRLVHQPYLSERSISPICTLGPWSSCLTPSHSLRNNIAPRPYSRTASGYRPGSAIPANNTLFILCSWIDLYHIVYTHPHTYLQTQVRHVDGSPLIP